MVACCVECVDEHLRHSSEMTVPTFLPGHSWIQEPACMFFFFLTFFMFFTAFGRKDYCPCYVNATHVD